MRRRRRLELEPLEDRTVPAVFGVPWASPRHLTLSFVPDGTVIAGHESNLFAALDAQMPRGVWQSAVLRAAQTWAANANLSIGVVFDGGQELGVPGLTQGDERFGDIRVGAQTMRRSALAISVPPDPFLSGTWAGDILINSTVDFTSPGTSLYGAMLHEIGHALGLAENNDPSSVMYSTPTRPRTSLSARDVAAVQALYGPRRADQNEGSNGNNTFDRASRLDFGNDNGVEGEFPAVAFGDLTRLGDVDVFEVRGPEAGGPLTFRLKTSEVSLLRARLTVYSESGQVLGLAQSTEAFGDVLTVTLPQSTPGAAYFVMVEGAVDNVFGTGRYGLAVTADAVNVVPADEIDAVLRGPFDTLPEHELDEIFSDPDDVLLDRDYEPHDTLDDALDLRHFATRPDGTRFGLIDHLTDGAAFYRVEVPDGPAGSAVMTVSVNALMLNGLLPRLQLYDRDGATVPVRVLVNGNGTVTVQAVNLRPGQRYWLGLTVPDTAPAGGNFSLVVDFRQSRELLRTFTSGSLTPATPERTHTLFVAQNQIFQFVLSAAGAGVPLGVGVSMAIRDSTGATVFLLTAPVGDAVSGASVLLTPGEYTVNITQVRPDGVPAQTLEFAVRGATISDPIGPVTNDPRTRPMYTDPNRPNRFRYPGRNNSRLPFFWLAGVL